jgi:protein SCO1/2
MRRGTLLLALGALLAGGARAGMPAGVVTKIATSPTLGRSTPGGKAPDFTLKAADGGTFTLAKAGRPVLLTFIFTECPGACPIVVEAAVSAARAVPKGLPKPLVVAVTFDPRVDTPKVLGEWAKARGIEPGEAKMLTGSVPDLTRVCESYAVHVGRNADDGSIFHTFATLVIDAKGNVVARHDGPEVDQKLLDEDAVEAARRSKDG